MRELDFTYKMKLIFSEPVTRHSFQLRCIPMERPGQHMDEVRFVMSPETHVSKGTDGLGNTILYGSVAEPHTEFSFTVSGKAQMNCTGIFSDNVTASMYKPFTEYTGPGDSIKALHSKLLPEDNMLKKAEAIMHLVHSEIAYVPLSTDTGTTAEQAAERKTGVCQDHAQIMLSLLRMEGIPCRYVSGLLLGEGRTHAWVEALIDGRWTGLDATNDMLVEDTHIAIAYGRDHSDCELNRGVMQGFAMQTQEVEVTVRDITEPKE